MTNYHFGELNADIQIEIARKYLPQLMLLAIQNKEFMTNFYNFIDYKSGWRFNERGEHIN